MSAPCALDAAAKAELPPRVVVQMPDGDLTLGENTGKLAVCEAFQKAKLAEMTTAEGGTHTVGPQRHARMVAAQYALSLQRLLSRRARLFAGPVGASHRRCAQALHGLAQRRPASRHSAAQRVASSAHELLNYHELSACRCRLCARIARPQRLCCCISLFATQRRMSPCTQAHAPARRG